MKAGDLVRVKTGFGFGSFEDGRSWPEAEGQIGIVIAKAMRLYVPAAKIMILALGEVAEFDIDELEWLAS